MYRNQKKRKVGGTRKGAREQALAPKDVSHLSPPLAYIFGISRLYFTCIPPVSHRILGIPCIPVSVLYLSIHFAADPLFPGVSHCIQLYPYVSSCI